MLPCEQALGNDGEKEILNRRRPHAKSGPRREQDDVKEKDRENSTEEREKTKLRT